MVPMIISSGLGETGQGPLGSTRPLTGSIPQDLNRRVSRSPSLPRVFQRKVNPFSNKGNPCGCKIDQGPILIKDHQTAGNTLIVVFDSGHGSSASIRLAPIINDESEEFNGETRGR